MTLSDIAARYVELARRGEIHAIHDELYAPDAVSLEPPNPYDMPRRVEGIDAMRAKEAAFFGTYVEAMHGGSCSDPILAAPYFACTTTMDVTIRGRARQLKEQVCVFEVEDGRIIREEFFYRDALA